MHADLLLGPVEHGRERDGFGVFKLTESGLHLGLGAVAGNYLGDGPVVVVGDQDAFAEEFCLQLLPRLFVDFEARRNSAGVCPVRLVVMTRSTQRGRVILVMAD